MPGGPAGFKTFIQPRKYICLKATHLVCMKSFSSSIHPSLYGSQFPFVLVLPTRSLNSSSALLFSHLFRKPSNPFISISVHTAYPYPSALFTTINSYLFFTRAICLSSNCIFALFVSMHLLLYMYLIILQSSSISVHIFLSVPKNKEGSSCLSVHIFLYPSLLISIGFIQDSD